MSRVGIEAQGFWFDGKTSSRVPARLTIDAEGYYHLSVEDKPEPICRGALQQLLVSPRLANTTRRLEFGSGAVFETEDNDSIDRAIKRIHHSGFSLLLHRLENQWHTVAVMAVFTLVFVWAFVGYGVPAIASAFASNMPVGFLVSSDKQTLAVMDRFYFKPSQLSEQELSVIRQALLSNLPEMEVAVTLEFRAVDKLGANAFALPGGSVVFTDKMLQLAENTEQLQAVFGHELGHLSHRHSLRRIAQNSIVSVLVALITGDATATSDLLTALPFLLTDMAYARQFELEADDYAWQYLEERQLNPQHFSDLMSRLECSQRSKENSVEDFERFTQCLLDEEWRWDADGSNWSDYLLSHPPSADRIRRFASGQ